MTADGVFSGFSPKAFAFFAGLREHNDPDWFKPRKGVYESEVLAPFRMLIAAVGAALEREGIPLAGDPGRAIFRIYRDVRFSADKRLYKTHQAAVLTRSGNKRDPGLLYLHLEPAESRLGAGFWHPEPALLARLRRAIAAEPDEFLVMAEGLAAAGAPLVSDAQLSRPPRGFDIAADSPVADYLCWKSFTARTAVSDAAMQSAGLVERIVAFARLAMPLLEWGWAAADDAAPPPIAIRAPLRPLPKPDF